MNTALAQQIANEGGVEAWMIAQQHKSLLRFLTCGSVDDGKSTLIGRLLHDTRQIYEDQLSSLHNDSKRHGTHGIDNKFASPTTHPFQILVLLPYG